MQNCTRNPIWESLVLQLESLESLEACHPREEPLDQLVQGLYASITGSSKAAPMVGQFFNALYKIKEESGELEGYSRTAVASTHRLPGEEDPEEKARRARRSFLDSISGRSIFGRRNR